MLLGRRDFLISTAAAALASAIATPAARTAARNETLIISETAIPARPAAPPLEFALFYDLSRFITVRSELDVSIARLLFERFRKEEWSWHNAATLYSIIRAELEGADVSAPEILVSRTLSEGDRWFATHLVEAWYTGIYAYEGIELRIAYAQSLMWQAVHDLVPVRGLSGEDYGFWGTRPEIGDRE